MQRSSFYTSVQVIECYTSVQLTECWLTECWLTCMYLLLGGGSGSGSGYFLSLAVLTHGGVNLD